MKQMEGSLVEMSPFTLTDASNWPEELHQLWVIQWKKTDLPYHIIATPHLNTLHMLASGNYNWPEKVIPAERRHRSH